MVLKLTIFFCTIFFIKKVLALYEHEKLVQEKVCFDRIEKIVENQYKTIHLTCNWQKFVDYGNKNSNNKIQNCNETELIFHQFDFYLPFSDPKYVTLKKDLFKNFRVQSLSMKSLNLAKIEENAFEKESFKHIVFMDLSSNKLQKINTNIFKNLEVLEKLNLSNNKIALTENNFQHLKSLKSLDLSGNQLQYIHPNVFNSLNRLEYLDLSNNNLEKVDACTLSKINTNPITLRFVPPIILMNNNPIDCDCNIFYLNRVLKYRLNLTCSTPKYYKGKEFIDLKNEDPSSTCKYKTIIIFGLLICACCCCCKNISKSNRILELKNTLRIKNEQSVNNGYYTQIPTKNDHSNLIIS
ncbi:unnamed protein product [Brachionus calyciflorus]|uniref:Uncharacterized protein n=1 Tax=Brachionus calyciflorus TaxID=104777 RepID=A0A814C8Z8_9BILA|nr:unnamed protein product [Brachionus calyciflorus]